MATTNWTGLTDNDWNTASNWSAGVPVLGDTAQFLSGPVSVSVSAAATVADLTVTVAGGVALTLSSSGAGSLDCGSGFGLIFNLGAGATASVSALIIGTAGVEALGAGSAATLFLSNPSNTFTGGVRLTNTFGAVVVHGLALGAFGSTANVISMQASTTLNLNSLAFTNPITYTGGTVAFSDNYAGTLSIAFGSTLTIASNNQFPAETTFRTVGGSTLNINTKVIASSITFTGGTVSNASTYTGTLTITGTTLTVGTNIANDFSGILRTTPGATLDLNSLSVSAATVAPSGGTITNLTSFSGTVAALGGASLLTSVWSAASLFVSSGNNSTLNFGGGALTVPVQLGSGGVLSNGSMPAANLTLVGSGLANVNVTLTGTGSIVIPSAVGLVLNVLPTSTGPVTVNGGLSIDLPPGAAVWSADIAIASGSTGVIQANTDLTLSGTISGAGNFLVDIESTLSLGSANTGYSGTITVQGASFLVAQDDAAFGTGAIVSANAGTSSDFNTIDFGGYAVANNVSVSVALANGYTSLRGGDLYEGAVTVGNGALAQIPSGNELAGTATVNTTGKLAIAGQHVGTLTNNGTVEVDNDTATSPAVNAYTGNCGSRYAVRAA